MAQLVECIDFFLEHDFVILYMNFSIQLIYNTDNCASRCYTAFQGRVFGFHIGHLSVCPSVFRFIDDELSKYQWIFIKRGMCIDIVEIWFGITNGQISSIFELSACHTIVAGHNRCMFLFLQENICSRYLLEAPHQGLTDEYHIYPKYLDI